MVRRRRVGSGGRVVAGGGGFHTPRALSSAAMGAAPPAVGPLLMGAAPPSARRSVRGRWEGDRAGSGSSAAHATQVATV